MIELKEQAGLAVSSVYELRLERVRLRAIAARKRRDGAKDELDATNSELARVDQALADLTAQLGDGGRDVRIASLLRLSDEEIELLWSVVAATADPTLTPQIRDLAGGEAKEGMSIALHTVVAGLASDAARGLARALTPYHPLMRYGILSVGRDGVPAARPLSAPIRVASYLAGNDAIDDAVLRVGGSIDVEIEPHFDEAQLKCVRLVAQALTANDPPLILLEGAADIGKKTVAATAALVRGQRLIEIDIDRMASIDAELEQTFIALRRECLLGDVLPLVSHVDALAGAGENRERLRMLGRLLDETPIPVMLTSSVPGIDLGVARSTIRVKLPVPDVQARQVLWQRTLKSDAPDADVELLSLRYRLGAGGIRRAVSAAHLVSSGGPLTTYDLIHGVRNGIAERLGEFAQRVDVKQEWDDLVLSADTMDQIKALVARVRHGHIVFEKWGFSDKLPRGKGTAALFSGPPGTGKTMVAGIIASELDLELYQVDLSRVVSKWVGETEKQLGKIFDAAEAGHALLLFDEADALFAKRTEVKSSNDRYANLEVNYLLQRIETFGGISILTTNLDTSIDPALRRRLAAHVVFYPPDIDERTTLWERLLPTAAPRDAGLDFESLAQRFADMTGANIRNAVLAAAFLAASEGLAISQEHLERAGRGEYRAMGRVIR